jgi:hypothetical protein
LRIFRYVRLLMAAIVLLGMVGALAAFGLAELARQLRPRRDLY